ncbi:MAG TPA: branched-chain amino acid ABC transporter permease [Candidatus Dormibacteraeota bacterium]|nr:branched-chain amino acid ABC transporter permease [Candidatus Dormibacteraeota bacterium]
MTATVRRWGLVAAGIVFAAWIPAFFDFSLHGLATNAAVTALLALSLVLLTGFVGQVSFCQYSFAALGAFTVGSLVVGHGVSFWLAALLGTAFAGVGGVLVGIPALRLRGLLLAVLTVAVALFVDVFVLTPGTWDGLTNGSTAWTNIGYPSFLGRQLESYTFYLFALGVFLLAALLVWNMRNGKTGRVLRAVRDSEVASSTLGLNVAAWKLAAFGVSAALAGLAGALKAVADASVAGGSQSAYSFQYSVALVASITVFGAGSIFSAAVAGFFIIFAPQALDMTPLSHQWFPLILGVILIVQLVFNPEGVVVKAEHDVAHALRAAAARRRGVAGPPASEAA